MSGELAAALPEQDSLVGSQADYARHAGISRQAVSKAVAAGTITPNDEGLIDFVEADYARQQFQDPARGGVRDEDDDTGGGSKPSQRQQAQIVGDVYDAKLKRLRFERESGLLIDRKEVEDALVTAARRIRSGIDGVVGMAEELDAAARNGGVDAVRAVLRKKTKELETMIAENLQKLGDDDGED